MVGDPKRVTRGPALRACTLGGVFMTSEVTTKAFKAQFFEIEIDGSQYSIEPRDGPRVYHLQEGLFRGDPVKFKFSIRHRQECRHFVLTCKIESMTRTKNLPSEYRGANDPSGPWDLICTCVDMTHEAFNALRIGLAINSEIRIGGYDPTFRPLTHLEIPLVHTTPF